MHQRTSIETITIMSPVSSTLLAVAGALFQVATSAPVNSSSPNDLSQCQQSKVLILGAGMAGISAGHALQQKGIHDFRIIEYQDRIGGRTLHTSFGKKPDGSPWTIELGTNWITGLHTPNGSTRGHGKYNPIWALAQASGLVTVEDELTDTSLFYDQHGPSNWSHVLESFTHADDRLQSLAGKRVAHGQPDLNARAGLELVGWDSTNDAYARAAEWLVWETDGAAPVELSSTIFGAIGTAASEGPELLGEYSRFVADQRGYDLVTRHLAGEYLGAGGDGRLVLESPIARVEYDDEGVTARTAEGRCFRAEYAVCTFSLGVLQRAVNHKAPVEFVPGFPAWKEEAVLGNVMGIFTKIFYQFAPEDVWWPKDVHDFYYASPTTKGYWGAWKSLDYPGSPLEGSGIIFATMVYEQSKRIERQSDEETMTEGLEVLRQMFPNATIPDRPQAFVYPRWGETPWAFGSYSNWAAGYSLEAHTNFRANLDRLWFAGEATSTEYWGYLHGAYYEGQAAGEEVAACLLQSGKDGEKDRCPGRDRYTRLKGTPKSSYNKANGFQDPIEKILGI